MNEFRVQFGPPLDVNNTDGWSTAGMPEINRPSVQLGKACNQPQGRNENRLQFINNFTYTMSSHDLKSGADFSFIRAPTLLPDDNGDGTFTFTTDAPFDANNLATYPTQFTQSIARSAGSIWTTTSSRSSCRTPGACGPTSRSASAFATIKRTRSAGSSACRTTTTTSRRASDWCGIRSTTAARPFAAAMGSTSTRTS